MSCLRPTGPERGDGPIALVCEAQMAAGGLSAEVMQHLRELHPELLDVLPPPLVKLLQQSIQLHGVRWLCATAQWWAERQSGSGDERYSTRDPVL